ncbi:sn-glycerol-3-phosphate ABC transporter ATP-binding protein UgpC [Erwinia endophytica]|uniref:ABC transporter ATP-binding protein n=1 Tax=Erwinia endophytica TaxID=1563158 RepID=UPI001265D87D|nr:sn-glycerol-3-phosphate ABC transporter ATP-binding protein UgpC [Erwinia endophytica]KAB8308025.1 sn-glycerol-3-phosphate ABC transporter ATP-binding protein UgpC [Erwinia endophytica]
MSTVKIRELTKQYGHAQVLRGINLDIKDGQFVVLVGPSGCGKSTLLRMIAGLEEVSSGHIAINERIVNDLPPKERDIAMVFQNYALYPHMTVRDNMAFSLKLRHFPPAEINARVEQVAASLGLTPLLSRYPRQLSGGQRQRVAMGRSVVRQPQVFLFDEPLSNLDAKLRVQMRSEIKQLHQRLHTTTVYVTHDQVEAMTMGDLVVVMRDGVIEQAGDPLSLYDCPANQFVASFLGSPAMNFLPGILQNEGSEIRFADGSSCALHDSRPTRNGGPVVFGIRPEHLHLAASGIPANVLVVEPTGSEMIVMLETTANAGNPLCMVLRQRHHLKPGERIFVQPQTGCEHLFESGSGTRISETQNHFAH